MPITAQSIVRRATDIIQDKTSVRWPADELVRWLNDAQREIALYRPDAFSTFGSIVLVGGSRQSLPAGAVKLIDIPNNTSGTKAAVRQVPRRPLDEQTPEWHGLTGVTSIKHFMYDPRDPRTFYVYPPAAASGAVVNAVYAVYPTDITEPAAGLDYTAVTGNINVPDVFANAVLDLVLYRAYSKDAEYAGNVARAQAHYTAAANSLGLEIKATVLAAPVVNAPGQIVGAA
jgi:hypothetical protein